MNRQQLTPRRKRDRRESAPKSTRYRVRLVRGSHETDAERRPFCCDGDTILIGTRGTVHGYAEEEIGQQGPDPLLWVEWDRYVHDVCGDAPDAPSGTHEGIFHKVRASQLEAVAD